MLAFCRVMLCLMVVLLIGRIWLLVTWQGHRLEQASGACFALLLVVLYYQFCRKFREDRR